MRTRFDYGYVNLDDDDWGRLFLGRAVVAVESTQGSESIIRMKLSDGCEFTLCGNDLGHWLTDWNEQVELVLDPPPPVEISVVPSAPKE